MESSEMEAVTGMFMALKIALEGADVLPRGKIEQAVGLVHAKMVQDGQTAPAAHLLQVLSQLADQRGLTDRFHQAIDTLPTQQPLPSSFPAKTPKP